MPRITEDRLDRLLALTPAEPSAIEQTLDDALADLRDERAQLATARAAALRDAAQVARSWDSPQGEAIADEIEGLADAGFAMIADLFAPVPLMHPDEDAAAFRARVKATLMPAPALAAQFAALREDAGAALAVLDAIDHELPGTLPDLRARVITDLRRTLDDPAAAGAAILARLDRAGEEICELRTRLVDAPVLVPCAACGTSVTSENRERHCEGMPAPVLVEAVRAVCESFADAAEAAVTHARGPKGGQQVPFHGDFASAPPSVIGRLDWWARAMRSALNGTGAREPSLAVTPALVEAVRAGFDAVIDLADLDGDTVRRALDAAEIAGRIGGGR